MIAHVLEDALLRWTVHVSHVGFVHQPIFAARRRLPPPLNLFDCGVRALSSVVHKRMLCSQNHGWELSMRMQVYAHANAELLSTDG